MPVTIVPILNIILEVTLPSISFPKYVSIKLWIGFFSFDRLNSIDVKNHLLNIK